MLLRFSPTGSFATKRGSFICFRGPDRPASGLGKGRGASMQAEKSIVRGTKQRGRTASSAQQLMTAI
jgi:hypothetical protein